MGSCSASGRARLSGVRRLPPVTAGDWADLEEMAAAGSLDVEAVLGVLVRYLRGDDPRVGRLRALG
jgi:hypothetical protein